MNTAVATANIRQLPAAADERERLGIRARATRDIGDVIARPGDPRLIAGVQIENGTLWPDDRGVFTELFRLGSPGLSQDFPTHTQISAAVSYAGTIKAIHFHRSQVDLWVPLRGQFQIVLIDLRLDAPSFGAVNTLYAGEWRPWRLRIPTGVGHGYKIVGKEPGLLVYATNRFYDPSDEGRIRYDDPGINYDWELQHK